ncbi:MAG: CoB--CoM heterodisulfide reductase iron-sulfur subunit A family protein [Candidatus Latescibacterota bacterium]
MEERRIGVYVCYCGGNISDYVDVETVREAVQDDPGVVVAKTTMFACSDAAQEEMIQDIKREDLDGLVIASCSPTLHLHTFRGVAERAGLNPYEYIQVNLREQCSWAHRDEIERATEKAILLVKGGVAKVALTKPLSTIRIETKRSVMVVGAGVAGMRAALALSDMNLSVYLIERSDKVGGWTGRWHKVFPNESRSSELVSRLRDQIQQTKNITLFTNAELVDKKGTMGDFTLTVELDQVDSITVNVGAIIVATGFDTYTPTIGEFGYGQTGVVTLPEFKDMVDQSSGVLTFGGRPVNSIAYIYCVGSRQHEGDDPHRYCSRYCCTAAVHTALRVEDKFSDMSQYHLYRDIRTYGKYEILYERASKKGSVFIRYDEMDPPVVAHTDGILTVTVNDQLLGGEAIQINPDLVVLVTGMVPRENAKLVNLLKLPIGKDRFFNEIHPKLRPVETVIDGVFIAGAAQGPKTLAESVASGLAAVSKSAALLMKGYADMDPLVATVNTDACAWCNKCQEACPYDAIECTTYNGKEVANVNPALCKGGGTCVPVCPVDAIEVEGYTDAQITAMIDSLAEKQRKQSDGIRYHAQPR